MKKSRFSIGKIVLCAVFTALVFALTFTVKLPTPTGYVHLGDLAIYIAASVLPLPYAVFAAGVGGALSDIFGGYMLYALPTFIIKSLLAVLFTSKRDKLLCRRNVCATVIGCAVTVIGYYITNACLIATSSGDLSSILTLTVWASAVGNILENLGQGVANGAAYLLLAAALDKLSFKQRLTKFNII